MAQEKPNPLSEWLQVLRTQVPLARRHAAQWIRAVRDEPALIWQTPAVRYLAYGLGSVAVVLVIRAGGGLFSTPLPPGGGLSATTADFHVVCSGPICGHHFVIHRKFGFRKFPVPCTKCRESTGLPARRCHSSTCRGRWVAPQERDKTIACPRCGAVFQ